jgi:hypothetical protein
MNAFATSSIPSLITTLIFASFCGASSAQTPTELDKQAWDYFNGRIMDLYKGLDKDASKNLGVHLMTVPKALPADDAILFKSAWLDLADTIPNWSPAWTPRSRFSDSYRAFAESVSIPRRSDVSAADFDKALKEYTRVRTETNATYRKVIVEYGKYLQSLTKGGAPLPWNAWLNNVSENGPAWQSNEAKRLNLQARLFNLYDPGARVIGSWKEQVLNFSFDPSNDYIEGTPRYPYNYASATAALKQIQLDAKTNQTNNKYQFDFEGARDKYTKNEESSSWGASASYGRFLGTFGASGGASGTHYSLETSQELSSISLKAYGFGRVSVIPGSWFAPVLIDYVRSGGSDKFLPGSPVSNSSLWGEKGSLNLRPVEVLVIIKPVFTAVMSSANYKRVVDTLKAGGSVSYGPFSFGGSYSKTTEKVDYDAQSGRVTVTNTSDTPYVIAVISQKLN